MKRLILVLALSLMMVFAFSGVAAADDVDKDDLQELSDALEIDVEMIDDDEEELVTTVENDKQLEEALAKDIIERIYLDGNFDGFVVDRDGLTIEVESDGEITPVENTPTINLIMV